MQDRYNEIITALIAAIIVFLVLAGVLVFILFFYQKKRYDYLKQVTMLHNSLLLWRAREDAFRQVSEELHDNIGQQLICTRLLLLASQKSNPDTSHAFTTALDTLSNIIEDLRSLSKTLNKQWLRQFNLLDNLRDEAKRINLSRAVTVSVSLSAGLIGKDFILPRDEQVMLFRIIQEAIQNGIRHAGANSIDIALSLEDAHLVTRISDNGKGFPVDKARGKGLGSINMTNYAQQLQGTIQWDSVPGEGTTVTIDIPTQN
jgi:signal transduction histidine kinase